MASPAYEQILAIQALDLTLRQLEHRRRSHPLRQQVAAVDVDIAEVDEQLGEIAERHHDLERQRKRLEDEAAIMADKRAAIDGKLYGGEITASKELLALQDEAAMLLARQTELEDQELELMEALEGVDGERVEASGRRLELDERRAAIQSELDAALADVDAETDTVRTRRTEAVAGADPTLLANYESRKDQFDGVAVARLVNGSCDGCHIRLSAVALDQMSKMAEDAVVTCEECGRLLVR